MSSSQALPIRALPSGDESEMRCCAPSTSSGTTISNSARMPSSRSSSSTLLPRPTVSRGIDSMLIIDSSATRSSKLLSRARRNSWRCLAIAHSAFSERSPWARARSSSFGSSTVSSRLSVSISLRSRLTTGNSAIDAHTFTRVRLLTSETSISAINSGFYSPAAPRNLVRDDRSQAAVDPDHALNLLHDQFAQRRNIGRRDLRDYIVRPGHRMGRRYPRDLAQFQRDFLGFTRRSINQNVRMYSHLNTSSVAAPLTLL